MVDSKPDSPKAATPSAKDLRMHMLQKQMEEMEKWQKARNLDENKRIEFAEKFLKEDITEEERVLIRRLVKNAVANGKFEVMVYSFPSKLTTDNGRAINNSDPNWPSTLKGKAKQLYDRFKTAAQPQGYKLKAMIVSFPDGMPGDVGFFLNWE